LDQFMHTYNTGDRKALSTGVHCSLRLLYLLSFLMFGLSTP
jgi:hypothetical protein